MQPIRHLTALAALTLALQACGQTGAPPAASAVPASAPPAPASPAAKPAASAAADAKPSASGDSLIKVTLSGGDPNGFPIHISQSGGGSVSMISVYAAIQQDFFKQQRLNASVVNIAGGMAPMAALTRGDIEFNNSPGEAVQAAIQGLPLKVVFSNWSKSPWTVVGKTQYSSLADLKGHLVGTAAAGTVNNLTLVAALKKANLTGQVTVVPTPSTVDIFNQLIAGTLDAGVVSPPFDSQVEEKGFHTIAFIGDALDLPYSGLGTSTAFIQNHRPQVVATIRALLDAQVWLKAHPDEASASFAKVVNTSPTIARKAIDTMLPLMSTTGEMSTIQVQNTLDIQTQNSKTPPNVSPDQLVDYGPLHEAIALGGAK